MRVLRSRCIYAAESSPLHRAPGNSVGECYPDRRALNGEVVDTPRITGIEILHRLMSADTHAVLGAVGEDGGVMGGRQSKGFSP